MVLRVMRGLADPMQSATQLKAATYVRLEVCGPVAQRHEVTGAGGTPLSVSLVINGLPSTSTEVEPFPDEPPEPEVIEVPTEE